MTTQYESLTIELLPELWGPGEFWAVGTIVVRNGYAFCGGQGFDDKVNAALYVQDLILN